jgi:4-amino-4-deoxy-L-arabinose transferase-like glycosyltransferase
MLVLRSRTSSTARSFLTSPRIWLVVILWLAWGLRLFHLGAMSVWLDESLSYDRARQDLATILSNTILIQNVTTQDLHPPLYFLLLHFAVIAFGVGEFALRTLSTFANVLTVALMFPTVLLIARTGSIRGAPRLAVLAALFAALSPFYVWYAQEARPYALVLLWSLLALYALLKMINASTGVKDASSGLDPPPRKFPSLYALLYFCALAATLFTHYLSFLLLPFHAAVLIILGRRKRVWWALALLLLGACCVAFLFVPGSAAELTGSDAGGATFVPLFIMLRDVLNSFAVGVTANLDRVAPLDLGLIALWCLGVASTIHPRRREYRVALIALAYLFLPALAMQAGSYLRPLYLNSRHLITTSPAFYIGLALGVNALMLRARRSQPLPRVAFAGLTATALVIIVYGAAYSLSNLYFDPAYAKDDHRAWSDYLRGRDLPGDLLILDAPQAEKIYDYYAPPGLEWISLPNLGYTRDDQERLDFKTVVDAYRNHARLWFLELHRPVADPTNHIYNLLQRFGTFVSTTYFPGTSTQIVLHEIVGDSPLLTKTPPIQHPLSLSFGDNLQLVGYDAPAQIAAGERDTVKLYWRLQKPSGEDFGVSLRLVDDTGARLGQWDAPPVGNLWPVSGWPAGKIVLDAHYLPVDPGTPPGAYHLTVSVYHAANQESLPISGSSDATARLGEISVTRPSPPLNPDALVMDHHSKVTFGDALSFVGYDEGDAPLHPGDLLPLNLYFQVLNNPERDISGRVSLAPPFYEFWNSTRAVAPFTLSLRGRLPGDIVQTGAQLRIPGDATGGALSLQLALEGEMARTPLFPTDTVEIGDTQVESIARSTSPTNIPHPMDVRLEDGIEFLGYGLSASEPLHAGDSLTLTLFWRTGRTLDTSYTVFTHLLDAGSRIIGQNDSLPANGARETTSWSPGDVIADAHSFVVNADAAPGKYTIEIGMYNAADETRLQILGSNLQPAGNRILLEELTVQ